MRPPAGPFVHTDREPGRGYMTARSLGSHVNAASSKSLEIQQSMAKLRTHSGRKFA